MPTDAELADARAEILTACRETYAEAPAAWIGWELDDIPDFATIEAAARALEAEGLIKARFEVDGTAIEAQLTQAGAAYAKAGKPSAG
jgi:hypothetical protein